MKPWGKSERNFWLVVGLAVYATVQVLINAGVINAFWLPIIELGAVMAIISLGLNLIYGFNGQFSLGQFGFYAIGAYASADITWRFADQMKAPLELGPFSFDLGLTAIYLIALGVGVALSALSAFLFGLPVLKLGSDYFGIATLGWTMMIYVLANNSDTILGFPEMKGARGMVGIPPLTNWTWIFLFLVLSLLLVRNLLYSSAGRAILSVREDETAAKAMGIDVARYKTISFVIGAALAGLAGGIYAHLYAFLHPSIFHFIKSFDPMIIVVFGGLGSMTGTVLAAFAWALLLQGAAPAVLPTDLLEWRYVLYAITLVVVMLVRSQGLMGGQEWGFLKRKAPPLRQAAAVTSDPGAEVKRGNG
jgi:branched-chain amino acid transport system permease protein